MTSDEETVADVLTDEGVRVKLACNAYDYETLEERSDDVGKYARELYELWLNELE